jgi:hypothetical protein
VQGIGFPERCLKRIGEIDWHKNCGTLFILLIKTTGRECHLITPSATLVPEISNGIDILNTAPAVFLFSLKELQWSSRLVDIAAHFFSFVIRSFLNHGNVLSYFK